MFTWPGQQAVDGLPPKKPCAGLAEFQCFYCVFDSRCLAPGTPEPEALAENTHPETEALLGQGKPDGEAECNCPGGQGQ